MALLGFGLKRVRRIAKSPGRPVKEVKPVLSSVAKRMLILGLTKRKVPLYGLLNLYPGLYDAQMILSESKMCGRRVGSSRRNLPGSSTSFGKSSLAN